MTSPGLHDAAAIAERRQIYRQCSHLCHRSQGGRGPNPFAARLSDEAVLITMTNGRRDATMPAFDLKMSSADGGTVHAYVKSADYHE